MSPSRGTGPLPRRQQLPGNLTRRTGAGSLIQVNSEVLFREVLAVGTPRHPGNQGAPRVGEGLPGIPVAISGVAQRLLHRHAGIGLALLHQFQGPQVVWSVAGQYLHGGDQLGIGVHHNRRLVPVEPLAAAFVAVAHLRVMHRHHPVLAHSVLQANTVAGALHVLEQQLPQQLRRRNDALPLRDALRQFTLRLPRHFQQTVRVSHNRGQQRATCFAVGPVDGRLSLYAGSQVPLVPLGLGPFLHTGLLHGRQRPQQLDDPVGQQIEGVPHRAPAQDVCGVSATRMPRFFR